MIKHIVLLTFKPSTPQQAIELISEGFDDLIKSIPEIHAFQHGQDARIFKGNADYALVAEFQTEAELKSYARNPKHQEFMARLIFPVIESYQCVQFHDTPKLP